MCTCVRTPCAFFLAADDVFETVSDRELRQIFEGQNRIHLEIKQLNRQLDMILDEQRRYVSAVTEEIAKRGAGFPGQQGQVSKTHGDSEPSLISAVGSICFFQHMLIFFLPLPLLGFPARDRDSCENSRRGH